MQLVHATCTYWWVMGAHVWWCTWLMRHMTVTSLILNGSNCQICRSCQNWGCFTFFSFLKPILNRFWHNTTHFKAQNLLYKNMEFFMPLWCLSGASKWQKRMILAIFGEFLPFLTILKGRYHYKTWPIL